MDSRSGLVFAFGPYRLDPERRRLLREAESVPLGDRQLEVLVHLVSNAGTTLSKDALIEAAWRDVAVTDNSLEQVISVLRRTLGRAPDGSGFIQTVARGGYRFTGEVSRVLRRESDETLGKMLAPFQAWLEGRAALETLEAGQLAAAQQAFERVLEQAPGYASAHIGLANACAFRFESTRADEQPDAGALKRAVDHALEACRLDPVSGEAWATYGFVLNRAGDGDRALAAARRAVSLEPDNWRHYLRLGSVSWGEERLRAAARALHLMPGTAFAHWLAATVHVARQALDAAERELEAGVAAQDEQQAKEGRFGAVGLHWLHGLVRLAMGDENATRRAFERELAFEQMGNLYARESCANTWYAMTALHLRAGDRAGALRSLDEALSRIPGHAPSLAVRAVLSPSPDADRAFETRVARLSAAGARAEAAVVVAVRHALEGHHAEAAQAVRLAVTGSVVDSTAWHVPVEPLLQLSSHPDDWALVLTALRARAA